MFADIGAGADAKIDAHRPNEQAQLIFVDTEMLRPMGAEPAGLASRSAFEQRADIEAVVLKLNELSQRVRRAPVGDELEARALASGREGELRVPRALQDRHARPLGEFGVGKILVAEITGPDMPFALQVIPEDRPAGMVLRCAFGVIVDDDVIECLGAGLEEHAPHRRFLVEQQRGVKPEQPRLEVIALLARYD
ncbi:hypothetical protein [Pseudaminobacter soli (ex Zhang et al. 2022)]|uniref:hypothetical protein n=1 Tax=Pseudaminobacter soli (ex Zhang et al. 2022) TaxID=2831468 RepID=UPI001AEE60A4|nr:hypothetical protein [Pseudaminobacter soli]